MSTTTAKDIPTQAEIEAKRAGRLATNPESAKGDFMAPWAGNCPLWHFRPFHK